MAETIRQRGPESRHAQPSDGGSAVGAMSENGRPRESKLKRAAYALPLLGLGYAATRIMNVEPAVEWAKSLGQARGILELPSGSVRVLTSFYGLTGLDNFLTVANAFFLPSTYNADPTSRRQLTAFLTDGAVFLTIWIFESARHATRWTPSRWPNIFITLGQALGIGPVSVLYCFTHYVASPLDSTITPSKNTNTTPTPTNTPNQWNQKQNPKQKQKHRPNPAALPAVLLTYLLPFYLTLAWPDRPARQSLLYAWQLHPLWLSVGLRAGGRVVEDVRAKYGVESGKEEKVREEEEEDRAVVRWSVGVAAALGAGVWWWSLAQFGFGKVFVPAGLVLPSDGVRDLTGYTAEFLRWDQVFAAGSHLAWMAYLFWDLKAAGMLREGWLKVVGLGLASVPLVGPGATVGLGWLFREHILATRTRKEAVN
ncbi:hypothetical protein F5144DRAFT_575712 [Chaetomium tenue]|uniref:Uncharacterized protein n=1 Tax=Chaetomium tenue TaxID=1854479 RepID=A0ACB7P2F2_9PEZI|nr:hypothetical protein F5144DRAFT_575712 [Chaetomium globosum]